MPGREPASSRPAGRVYRAWSGTVTLIVAGVVAIVLLGDAALRAGWGEMLLLAPWVLLAVWVVYVVMYVSMIETDAGGATVQNFLRRTRVPWSAVSDIRLHYQVVFVLHSGAQVKAFGGPVAGRPARVAPGRDAPRREPPALRELSEIREQWDAAADAGAPAAASAAPTKTWDVAAIAAFAALVAWAVIALLITGGPA
ncbi:hypothetical protein [Microbacterium aurum]